MKLLLAVAVLTSSAFGQWINYPSPKTPRTRDGKADLFAKAPRTRDGKPDLSGLWHIVPTSKAEMKRLFGDDVDKLDVATMEVDTISKYAINVFADLKPADWPVRTETAAQMKTKGGFVLTCLPAGIPLSYLVSEPDEIVQAPNQIIIRHELDGSHRQIHTDGRPLPRDPSPSWLGYSAGRWEGDTLVVETTGFNDKTFLDIMGHPHSDALRVTERYHRRDFGHMDIEMTFDDSKLYTKPFSIRLTQQLMPDSVALETVLCENEKDLAHLGKN